MVAVGWLEIAIAIAVAMILLGLLSRRTGVRHVFAIAVVVIVAVGIGLLTVRFVTSRSPRYVEPVSYARVAVVEDSSLWAEKASDVLRPGLYPSAQQAAAEAAMDVLTRLLMIQDASVEPPLTARVEGDVPSEVLIAVVDRIQRAKPQWNVSVTESSGFRPGERAVLLNVEIAKTYSEETLADGIRPTENSGEVRVSGLFGPEPKSLASRARFIGKSWVHDLASFTSTYPDRSWLVSCSPRPCKNQAEAEQAAVEQAAQELLPRIERRLSGPERTSLSTSNGAWTGAKPTRDRELELLEVELQRGAYIVDRFVQSFDRPYGKLWHAKLLIDSSDHNLTRLAQAITNERRMTHRSWKTQMLSIGAVFAIVIAIYLFLNAATKGYYAWSLRGLALVAVAGATLVLLTPA